MANGFSGVQIFRKYLPLIDNSLCAIQDKVNVMGYGADGDIWRYNPPINFHAILLAKYAVNNVFEGEESYA